MARKQSRVSSQLKIGVAGALTALLSVALVGLATWRAYLPDQVPPTPTIPPVQDNTVYVSNVRGSAQTVPAAGAAPAGIRVGQVITTGEGSLVRTSGPSWVRLGLSDDAILFVDANSEIELLGMGEGAAAAETRVKLNYGRLLLSVSGTTETRYTVLSPIAAGVWVQGKALVGVEFNTALHRLDIDCLTGPCHVVDAGGGRHELESGRRVRLTDASAPWMVLPALYTAFQDLGDRGLVPTVTPTPTQSPTPTVPPATVTPAYTPGLVTATPTATPQPALTNTPTTTPQPTATTGPTVTPTVTPLTTVTPQPTPTSAPTATATGAPEATATATATPGATPTATYTPQATATGTAMPTATATAQPTATATTTPTQAATQTPTSRPPTATPTAPPSSTPTAAATQTPTATVPPTATPTPAAASPTPTLPATATPTVPLLTTTPTAAATNTPTAVAPTSTPTAAAATNTPVPTPGADGGWRIWLR